MIEVKDLAFSYTTEPFIVDVAFSVEKGQIFGFLGPSGAGKSTLQKILTGLITTYAGLVQVNGCEAKKRNREFYEKIGVDFEFSSLYEKLTARENLQYFSSLYKYRRQADPMLERLGLLAEADKKVADFSKGMRTRLNFIKALLHDPALLFLDEPTSGLDPANARLLKDMILEEKSRGKTIILTTHNMYDATELCDQVAFIVEGKLRALDSPANLIMSRGATKLRYSYREQNSKVEKEVLLSQTAADKDLQQVILENRLLSIHSSEPTLNDIFVELTGRRLQ